MGGLVGYNSNGNISDSYATGAISGNFKVGSLVGGNDGGTITASFWDIQATGYH
ncbi:MAG: GLUG motif-containing protein [Bacillota bacterium]